MNSKKQHQRLRIWGIILFLALGALVTPVILVDDGFATSPEGVLATSSNTKKSTKNQQKNNKNNDENNAESGYADPQGVKKSLNDSMNTVQDATDKFSTGLTVLVVALIAVPVLGLIFAIVRQALKTH